MNGFTEDWLIQHNARISKQRREADEIFRPGRKPVRVETVAPRVATGSFGLVTEARDEQARVEFQLSRPPGVNNLYLNIAGKGRIRSPHYDAWLDESAAMIAEQKPGRVAGKFIAEIEISRPDNRRRDLDGLIKALLDCAVKNRIVSDDHLAEKITISWRDHGEGARVVLTRVEGGAA